MRKHSLKLFLSIVAAMALTGLIGAATATAALPVVYDTAIAGLPGVINPQAPPAGANDWSCKPSAAHPRPVVLVHGTFANMGENFGTISPLLKNNGYCVYAFNYGATSLSNGLIYALAPIPDSAAELSTFVNKVLASTGKSKVDIVGHSQGGMMPNYYLKFLGGAPKVNALVGLAPDNHGTDLNGLLKFANDLSGVFPQLSNSIYGAIGGGAQGLLDQKFDSPFIAKMNSVPDTVAGVKYTVIATKYDEVVTPYTSGFLSGSNVKNITIQNKCVLDLAEHIAIAFDHVALREMLNALDPAHARGTLCTVVRPILGG